MKKKLPRSGIHARLKTANGSSAVYPHSAVNWRESTRGGGLLTHSNIFFLAKTPIKPSWKFWYTYILFTLFLSDTGPNSPLIRLLRTTTAARTWRPSRWSRRTLGSGRPGWRPSRADKNLTSWTKSRSRPRRTQTPTKFKFIYTT